MTELDQLKIHVYNLLRGRGAALRRAEQLAQEISQAEEQIAGLERAQAQAAAAQSETK